MYGPLPIKVAGSVHLSPPFSTISLRDGTPFQVEVWRAGLKEDHRLRVNHPSTTWRAWSASKKGATPRRSSRTNQYKEEVRRLQEENDKLRGRFDRASAVDRAKLAKILGMLGSSQDGEVLNAVRMAEDMRQQANLTWEDLLGVT